MFFFFSRVDLWWSPSALTYSWFCWMWSPCCVSSSTFFSGKVNIWPHIWESLAPKTLQNESELNFIYFTSVYLNVLNYFFSQIYTHDLLLINFQSLSFLKYCSTSWLTFSIIFISAVFFSCSNHYYHFSFYSRFIEISLLCNQNFL